MGTSSLSGKTSEAQLVEEYLARVARGSEPDLQEFLESVPDDLREGTFRAIDAALANRGVEDVDEYLVPRTEVVLAEEDVPEPSFGPTVVSAAGGEWWIRLAALAVPRGIRRPFLGDVLALRRELAELDVPRLAISVATLAEIFRGLAQRAPLRDHTEAAAFQPPLARGAAARGWFTWRISGTALFLGKVLGLSALVWVGVVALVYAFATLIVVTASSRTPWGHRQVRLANGVMGGLLLALTVTLLGGALTASVLGLAASFGVDWLAGAAFEGLTFLATLSLAAVTASGWAPEPWAPRRLVRM